MEEKMDDSSCLVVVFGGGVEGAAELYSGACSFVNNT